ncbi:MAG: PAS domain-containing protein [Pseudorhodobacter sp.]
MILSFFGRKDASRDPQANPARQMATARLRLIRDYWAALCAQPEGDRTLPRRAAISPRGIENALSQSFLIERVAPGMARLRIAGMDLNDLMGMDVRGMPFSCLLEPSARGGFGAALEQVFAGRSLLEAELEADRSAGRPALAAQLLILPLAVEPDGRRMALGGLACHGLVGSAPRRFHVARRQLLPSPLGEPDAAPVRAAPAFAENAAQFQPAPGDPAPGRGHLRLVK